MNFCISFLLGEFFRDTFYWYYFRSLPGVLISELSSMRALIPGEPHFLVVFMSLSWYCCIGCMVIFWCIFFLEKIPRPVNTVIVHYIFKNKVYKQRRQLFMTRPSKFHRTYTSCNKTSDKWKIYVCKKKKKKVFTLCLCAK